MKTCFSIAGAALALAAVATCGGGSMRPDPIGDPLRMSCPADTTIHGALGPSQPVTFDPPTAQAGTAPVNVTCQPASGSAFSIGNTPVRCTATDALSRMATCAFNVTLTGVQLAVTRFVAFGDSVTEGQNGTFALTLHIVDVPNAYPTKLQLLLQSAYSNDGIEVPNRGLGGEDIREGKVRLGDELAQYRPGALLLIDGYNNLLADCQTPPTSRCPIQIDTVVGTLREMVRMARGVPYNVTHVFVGTLTPPGPFRGGSRDRRISNDAIARVNEGIRQLVPLEGATVVDIYALFLGHESEYVAPDGLHLEPAGNSAIAQAFFDAIRAVVRQNPLLRPAE